MLPAWSAAIVQVPALSSATLLPVTEQTDVVTLLKLTARPELAVALSVNAPLSSARPASVAKLVLCDSSTAAVTLKRRRRNCDGEATTCVGLRITA